MGKVLRERLKWEKNQKQRNMDPVMPVCNIFMSQLWWWTNQGRSDGCFSASSAHGMFHKIHCKFHNSNAYIGLNSTRTFLRTIDGGEITFDNKPKLPKLQNIASHVTECKGSKTDKTIMSWLARSRSITKEHWDDGGIFKGERIESTSHRHL